MTDVRQCPKCGGKMRLGRVQRFESFISKRRDCCQCPYADRVFIREEIERIIEVEKRAKKKSPHTESRARTNQTKKGRLKTCSQQKTFRNVSG